MVAPPVGVCLMVVVAGCGGGGGPGGGGRSAPLGAIVITPSPAVVLSGDTYGLVASGRDTNGAPVAIAGGLSWATTPGIGTVAPTGPTTATFTATTTTVRLVGIVTAAKDGITGTANVTVPADGEDLSAVTGYSRLVDASDITRLGTGAISGIISFDGWPVGGATVALGWVSTASTSTSQTSPTARTNGAGEYGFANVPSGRYSLSAPAGGTTSLSHCIVTAGSVAGGGQVVTPTPEGATVADALAYLSQVRRTAGLGPVVLDASLQGGVDNHANYLVLNHPLPPNHSAHTEVPGNPGYTQEGAAAAAGSNISRSWGLSKPRRPPIEVASLINAPFHRLAHLEPDWERTAVGYATGSNSLAVAVVNVLGGLGAGWGLRSDPVLYPTPGQTNVPTTYWGGESPDPLNGVRDSDVGYPITCQFPGGSAVTGTTATISPLGGAPMATYLTTPDAPATDEPAASTYNLYSIVMLPRDELAPNTTYTVRLAATYGGSPYAITYNFTTGSTVRTASAWGRGNHRTD